MPQIRLQLTIVRTAHLHIIFTYLPSWLQIAQGSVGTFVATDAIIIFAEFVHRRRGDDQRWGVVLWCAVWARSNHCRQTGL